MIESLQPGNRYTAGRLLREGAGERAGCLLVLAAAWAVWIRRLGVADLDDAASNEVLFARQSLPTVLFDVRWPDQSPLYFFFLHFWRRLGEDPATIKALNLVLLTASLLVVYEVARQLCSRRVALGTVALAALSPASLWVVRNGRMYSLQLLLWALCLYFMVRYAERRRRGDLAAFVVAATLCMYNHFVGFVSTATALLWLAIEAVVETRALPAEQQAAARRRLLGPPIAAGVVILLLVQPQVIRLLRLLQAPPPVLPWLAVPGGWLPFLDRMSWFWFMSGGWGPLSPREPLWRALYLASAYLLFVLGLARGSPRMRRLVLVTVVIPLVAIGLAAGRMDWRDRHLLYMLPLIWTTIVNGALAGDAGEGVRVPRFVSRAALAVLAVTATTSAWMLHNKLPERYPEWSRLMKGLARIYRPSMVVYMPPSNAMSMPTLLGSRFDPGSSLGTVRPLSEETRRQFLDEASAGRDFVFLVHWTYGNEELAWRAKYLSGAGYHKTLLPAWGAHAEIFTREGFDPFATVTSLGHRPSAREAVEWARGRARDPSRARQGAHPLGRAVVARARADGTLRESTFFTSQDGESGYWRLSAADYDAVAQERVPAGAVEKEMLVARPTSDSLLLIVFPAMDLKHGLQITCGSGAPAAMERKGGVVSAQVFVDGDESAVATCPLRRLSTEAVAARPASGQRADVTLVLTAVGSEAADVAFRLEPPERTAPAPAVATALQTPFEPTASRTLKDFLANLTVYRTSAQGFGRVAGRLETAGRSAATMHESPGPDAEGGLDLHWSLGDLPWDAVGLTRQRSGGEPRSGLWAHPKQGTLLVIESDAVVLGPTLEGFYGLTDLAAQTATTARIEEPIGFRVLVDGQPLLEREVPRARGWKPFSVALTPARPGPRRLRIEVDAKRDDWAHLVFDLWSGGPTGVTSGR